jgi:hypothetical protein
MRVYCTYSKNSKTHIKKCLLYKYKHMDTVNVLLTLGLARKPVLK